MRVVTSPDAERFIGDRGGTLFVWADPKACCGGTRFIRSSTRPPKSSGMFRAMQCEPFALLVRASGRLPDELQVEVRGRRWPRVQASWDGCAFLV